MLQITSITWQETLPIRHQVLWPNKPISFCQVEGDAQASHYGVFYQQKLVCVASIYINDGSARLIKFATLPSFQKQGIGSKMINHLINELKAQGINYLWFDARMTSLSFYKKFDFKSEGQVFYKSQVAYYKMYRNL